MTSQRVLNTLKWDALMKMTTTTTTTNKPSSSSSSTPASGFPMGSAPTPTPEQMSKSVSYVYTIANSLLRLSSAGTVAFSLSSVQYCRSHVCSSV